MMISMVVTLSSFYFFNTSDKISYKVHSEGCNDDPNGCGHSEIVVNGRKFDGFEEE